MTSGNGVIFFRPSNYLPGAWSHELTVGVDWGAVIFGGSLSEVEMGREEKTALLGS